MGFIKAFTGALGGSFADQWKDFYMPPEGVPATAGLFPAKPKGTNHGRGENTKGNDNIITSGSKIIVPEGTALITMEDGAITALSPSPADLFSKLRTLTPKAFSPRKIPWAA